MRGVTSTEEKGKNDGGGEEENIKKRKIERKQGDREGEKRECVNYQQEKGKKYS